jgi:rhodanese-related sulfurtransferase
LDFLYDNIFLVIIAFVSGGMLVWPLVSRISGVKHIGTLEATQLLNSKNGILVDLREDNQIASGIIPQAIRSPFSNFQEGIVKLKKKSKPNKNPAPIILLTSSGSGASSVVKQLEKDGFAEVFVLNGGFDAWKQAGLPVRSDQKL